MWILYSEEASLRRPTGGIGGLCIHALVVAGDCGRIMSGGTIGGNVIASQLLGWPAGQLYKNIYNPS
jgi:hypothetical protein